MARVWAGSSGAFGFETLLAGLFRARPLTVVAAIAAVTVYLCWACISERLLTLGHVGGAILVSAAFGAASVTVLGAAGVHLSGMSTADAVLMLSPALLPLTASVLAPWSFSRVRHT